jgi:hypothetical protein
LAFWAAEPPPPDGVPPVEPEGAGVPPDPGDVVVGVVEVVFGVGVVCVGVVCVVVVCVVVVGCVGVVAVGTETLSPPPPQAERASASAAVATADGINRATPAP